MIIHKITDDTKKSKAENQRDDLDRILHLCKLVTEQTYDTNDITIKRLGKKLEKIAGTDTTATRPTLVTFTYPDKKALLMKNLHKLGKTQEPFSNMVVKHDMSKNDREQDKTLQKRHSRDQQIILKTVIFYTWSGARQVPEK